MLDRAKFYAYLRRKDSGVFGNSLSQGQVDGIERLLNAQEKYLPDMWLNELAYNLATCYHETGRTMQPIMERGAKPYFNKYEPGTRIGKVLGNTIPGDGYRFRGAGDVQNTGRGNARRASDRLNELFGLGIDMEKNPDLRLDPTISALSLFIGNHEGWWTGVGLRSFIDDIDENDDEDLREFKLARKVVNGTDKARMIGEYALSFEKALQYAGYTPESVISKPSPAPIEPVKPPISVKPTPKSSQPATEEHWFIRLIRWLLSKEK